MKIIVNYNEVTIESSITYEDMKKVQKYAPEALMIKTPKGNPKFVVQFDPFHKGADHTGIIFNGCTREDKLFTTLNTGAAASMPEDKVKDYIEKTYGICVVRLKQVEEQVAAAMQEVNATIASVSEQIVINN